MGGLLASIVYKMKENRFRQLLQFFKKGGTEAVRLVEMYIEGKGEIEFNRD